MTHPIPNIENHFSNLGDKFSSAVQATAIANPHWVIRNPSLAQDLKLDLECSHQFYYLVVLPSYRKFV